MGISYFSWFDRKSIEAKPDFHLLETHRRKELAMLSPALEKAYRNFYDATLDSEVLSPKTTALIQMAAAMGLGCEP